MMSITLELKPETEHQVIAEAAARGVSVEAYLTSLIESRDLASGPEGLSPEQLKADMDLLAEGSERLPVLPPDALTRKNIYGDHD